MTSSKKKFAPKSISIKKLEEGIANDMYYASSDAPLLHKGYIKFSVSETAFENAVFSFPKDNKYTLKSVKINNSTSSNLSAFAGTICNVWVVGKERNGRIVFLHKTKMWI